MIKLYKSKLNEEIEEQDIISINELIAKIDSFIIKEKHDNDDELVFLLAIEQTGNNKPEYDEIFVFEYMNTEQVMNSYDDFIDGSNLLSVHLFAFESYEDAYKVALDMRENNHLCYN